MKRSQDRSAKDAAGGAKKRLPAPKNRIPELCGGREASLPVRYLYNFITFSR
jgi:hypothetical protein